MKMQCAAYSLSKKNKLNAQDTSTTQEGALIKVIEGDDWGVADLCPHPELGDLAWQQEIQKEGTLFCRARELALEDLKARQQKKSLLQNKWVSNNYLVSDYRNFDFTLPKYAGKTLKIKADRDVQSLIQVIKSIPSGIQLRIDFNNGLDFSTADLFFKEVSQLVKKIDYIEDPTMYELEAWNRWNQIIPLAWDFQKDKPSMPAFKYHIIKPARQSILPEDMNYTLTSSMDHPVGIAHGLRIAQKYAQNQSGFLTLELYESTPFHRFFQQHDNELNFSSEALSDFGIGMTAELNKLSWMSV